MFNRGFCVITESVPRRHLRESTQFIQHLTHEELKNRAVRAQETLSTFENPMIKEQKLQNQICTEVQKLNRNNFVEEKRRVLLHKNEEEIRILDAQLKRANVQRQLVEQKALKERQLKDKSQARLQESKRFEEELKRLKQMALEEEKERVQKQLAFRQDILKQIQEKDEEIKREKRNIAREHERRQRLTESVQQDLKNEKELELKLKEKLQQERSEYQKAKLLRNQDEFDVKKDIRNYEEMCRQREEENRLRNEKRKQALKERAALSERIGQQVFNLEKEKQRRHEVLLELLCEERLAKDEERFKRNLEIQVDRAKSLQEDFKNFFACREDENLLKREDEKKAMKEELELFQQLKRRDAEIKNLRSARNCQYRQELLNAVEYKNAVRDLEVLQNKKEHEHRLALQKKHQQEIEAEKLRMFQAQPLDNFKFIPTNAISNEHRALLGLNAKIIK